MVDAAACFLFGVERTNKRSLSIVTSGVGTSEKDVSSGRMSPPTISARISSRMS